MVAFRQDEWTKSQRSIMDEINEKNIRLLTKEIDAFLRRLGADESNAKDWKFVDDIRSPVRLVYHGKKIKGVITWGYEATEGGARFYVQCVTVPEDPDEQE